MLRAWEVELQMKLGYDAVQYGAMPIPQRARFICAMKLPQWYLSLEQEQDSKELKAKSNGASNHKRPPVP